MKITDFSPDLIFEVNSALKPEDRWPNLEDVIQKCRELIPFNSRDEDANGIFIGWGHAISRENMDLWAFHHTISTYIDSYDDEHMNNFFSWHSINPKYESWDKALYQVDCFDITDQKEARIVPVYNVGNTKDSPRFVEILREFRIDARLEDPPLTKVKLF